MRRRVRIVGVLAALGAGAAPLSCWSLTADFDVSGGPKTGEGPPSSEGGAPGTSGGPGPSLDGASSTPGPDAATGSVCDRAAGSANLRLCDSFDDALLGAKWSHGIDRSGVGNVGREPIHVTSAPFAMFATVSDHCPAGAWAQLVDEANGKPAHTVLDFELSLAPMGAAPSINLAGWYYVTDTGQPKGWYRTDVAFRDGHLELYGMDLAGDFATLVTATEPFSFDTFHHVTIDASFPTPAAPNARIKVVVDGTTHIDTPHQPFAPAPTTTTRLDLGIYTGSACDGAIEARFDDVVYHLETW